MDGLMVKWREKGRGRGRDERMKGIDGDKKRKLEDWGGMAGLMGM